MAGKEKLRCWQCNAKIRHGESLCQKCGAVAKIYTSPVSTRRSAGSSPSSRINQYSDSGQAFEANRYSAPSSSSRVNQYFGSNPYSDPSPSSRASQGSQQPSWTVYSRSAESPSVYGTPVNPEDASSALFAVIGFLFPFVGLILFLVWQNTMPLRAKSAGKGALASVIVGIALSCMVMTFFMIVLSYVE